MPIFPKNIGQALLGTDWTLVYVSPATGKTIIKSAFLCNVSLAQSLVDIALVKNGESVSDKSMLFTQRAIEAQQSDIISEVIVLEPGDVILAKSSVPTSMLLSGVLATDVSYFTRHNDLQNLQGDGPDFYHLTLAEHQAIAAASQPSAINPFVTVSMLGENKWKIVNADYEAQHRDMLFVDTSGGQIVIILPPNPVLGTFVGVVDAASSFDVFPMVFYRNGKKIMGIEEDMTVSTSNQKVVLTYSDEVNGWRITG